MRRQFAADSLRSDLKHVHKGFSEDLGRLREPPEA